MSSIPVYDQASFKDLQARTQYESWLLEAVYDVAGSPVLVDWPDQMVFTRMCPNQDVVFDLRVVTVNTDGSKATGYLFPWDEINGVRAQLVRAVVDIAHRQSPLPEDIDTAHVSQELNMAGGEHRIAS
ncbi:MAG: hypothetical protein Q8K00_14255 [Syntrophales bacterium]|nr:hypothetical protein [Syntrophales bacterium]